MLSEIVSRRKDKGETLWFYNPSQRKEAVIEELVSLYSTPMGKEEILNVLVTNYMGIDQKKNLPLELMRS